MSLADEARPSAERLSHLFWTESGLSVAIKAALRGAPNQDHREDFWTYFACSLTGAMAADIGKEGALRVLSTALNATKEINFDQAEALMAKARGEQH